MSFEESFAEVVGIEGRYSNDPADSGGETMYGITARVARAYGYLGSMRMMPLSVAHAIYRKLCWDKNNCDSIAAAAGSRVAHEVFDTAVNLPFGFAAKFLQRSLNVLNQNEKLWRDIPVDGDAGNLTIEALRAFVRNRGQEGCTVLLRMLNSLQGAHYINLGEARSKDERFVFGWFKNRVVIA